MVFENLCTLVKWTRVASALEGLVVLTYLQIFCCLQRNVGMVLLVTRYIHFSYFPKYGMNCYTIREENDIMARKI